MANTDPVADTAGVVEQVWRLGREAGYCDVQPVGAVTVGLEGTQLAELGAMADSAARVRVFSDDGKCVDDAVLMRRALEYVKAFDGVVAQHAQEPRLTEGAQMNEGVVSGRLGPDRLARAWPRRRSSPATACSPPTSAPGCTSATCPPAGSVEIVRWAKSQGLERHRRGHPAPPAAHRRPGGSRLARTTRSTRSTRRCAPRADVEALREALADGTHRHRRHRPRAAPGRGQGDRVGGRGHGHARPGDRAQRGPGTPWSTPGLLDWAGVADRMSVAPARIGRLGARHGRADRGRRARQPHPRTTRYRTHDGRPDAAFASKSRNTPYEGMTLPGRVVATFLRGRPTVLEGKLRLEPTGRCSSWKTAGSSTERSYGADGETFGEMVFTTGMTGYQETLTDPSYHRQIVAHDGPAHRQHRRQRRGPRVGPRSGSPGYVVRDPARVVVQLAGQPLASTTSSRSRASSASRSPTPARSPATCASAAPCGPASSARRLGAGRALLVERVREAAPRWSGADLAAEVTTGETYVVPADRRQAVHGRRRRPRHQGA